jgi:Arc/MetJ-type ribon-helix-helix transcriptional regulator
MKTYIHARLSKEDRAFLDELKESTGHSESELVRRGLKLVLKELGRTRSALELAGHSVGKFAKGPKDLARNKKHLEGFGE